MCRRLVDGVTAFVQTTVAGAWALDQFPITGRVTGRKLSWRVDVKQGGAQGRMEFDGELDERGTAISGTCNVGDQFGSFTMKKQ